MGIFGKMKARGIGARRCLVASLAVLGMLLTGGATADEVAVGVASNFRGPLSGLTRAFERETGHRLRVSVGSTGQLYAQIVNGAPYDVFLAADQARPAALIASGHAIEGSAFTYAEGRLFVLLGSGVPDAPGALTGVRRLAIANPRTAPYGAAAMQVIAKLGLEEVEVAQAQSITGVNAAMRAGAADAGFAALASIDGDRGWPVPRDWHDPIRQDAVLLRRGAGNAGARAFLAWLARPETRALIKAQGYD